MLRWVALFLVGLLAIAGCNRFRATNLDNLEVEHITAPLTVQTIALPKHSYVWWEAEKPSQTNFPPSDRNPFAPQSATEASVLSDGQWVGVEGKRDQTLFLEYRVSVPVDADYFFYSRKFWRHGPFRWRWDDQPWREVGKKVYLMDSAALRQFVGANWVPLGSVALEAGSHTLRIELTENDGAAAFDCFVLTRSPFQPQGKLKPDQRYQADLPDWFLFDPEADSFGSSPIDLRGLNEAIAGENGWVQVRGERFVHERSQQPVRFWAVNMAMENIHMDDTSIAYLAKFLAKRGVNLVRLHGPLWSEDLRKIPADELSRLTAFINGLKQEGIYTSLSIYFPLWLKLDATSGFPGYEGQNPFGLLFFNPEFQQRYYGWWRSLLTTVNPATGKPLRDDPAIAMLELVNEDSLLFWTFNDKTVPVSQMALLEKLFGDWLTRKYGSIASALDAWGRSSSQADQPEAGRVRLLPLVEILSQRDSQRAQDTATFLAWQQQQFFQQAIQFLRRDLQYKGLIYGSNWKTADARLLDPLDKYSNRVGDFFDRHGYFGGIHRGDRASYSISNGDQYVDRSALSFMPEEPGKSADFSLPIMDLRYDGKPSTISEINWVPPNRYRAEFPLLAAAYGQLQGTDGLFFFATNHHSWEPGLSKFTIASPAVMGQFPAAALLYRKGLVKEAESVADVALNQTDLFALRGAPVSTPQNFDALRSQDVPPGKPLQTNTVDSIDPLAFLVGKVGVRFTEQPAPSQIVNLADRIDRTAKTVRSATDQLLWDYGKGIVTVNAPQVQGVTGFLRSAGTLKLPNVTLTSAMEYGTLLLVSLDDRPLATSRKMLLQAMSEEQNFNWRTVGRSPKTIESVGQPPIVVRKLSGQIELGRSDATSLTVTALDANGSAIAQLGNAAKFNLQPTRFYYLIEKP